jgi:hypothetical protein
MIKDIIILCDDEQNKAHEAWLEEQRNILKRIEDMMADANIDAYIRYELYDIYSFIKRGEM